MDINTNDAAEKWSCWEIYLRPPITLKQDQLAINKEIDSQCSMAK